MRKLILYFFQSEGRPASLQVSGPSSSAPGIKAHVVYIFSLHHIFSQNFLRLYYIDKMIHTFLHFWSPHDWHPDFVFYLVFFSSVDYLFSISTLMNESLKINKVNVFKIHSLRYEWNFNFSFLLFISHLCHLQIKMYK